MVMYLFYAVFVTLSIGVCAQSKNDVEMNEILDQLKQVKEEVNQLREVKQDVGQFKAEVQVLREEMKTLKEENYQKDLEIDSLKYDYQSLMTKVSKVRHMNTTVSFTAYATGTLTYATGTTILFGSVVRNYGGFYNSNIGVFTCPETGIYLFFVSLHTGTSSTGYTAYAEIQLAGEGLVDVRVIGYSHGSNFVVTSCERFQQVSVRSLSSSRIYGAESARYSTFSGTLLYYEP